MTIKVHKFVLEQLDDVKNAFEEDEYSDIYSLADMFDFDFGDPNLWAEFDLAEFDGTSFDLIAPDDRLVFSSLLPRGSLELHEIAVDGDGSTLVHYDYYRDLVEEYVLETSDCPVPEDFSVDVRRIQIGTETVDVVDGVRFKGKPLEISDARSPDDDLDYKDSFATLV